MNNDISKYTLRLDKKLNSELDTIDGTRRVMEVLEAERYSQEEGLKTRSLFKFCVDDNIEHKDGTVKVKGHFEKVNGISKRLQRILLNNGAPKKIVEHYKESKIKEE